MKNNFFLFLIIYCDSFNSFLISRPKQKTKRILKPGGWFACLWNHRDLTHPLQAEVENLIKSRIEGYGYGSRREDQTEAIQESRLFDEPQYIEASIYLSESLSKNQWHEIENDLIAAHVMESGQVPAAQFLG